jgi:peptidoglycan/LPS O-acetylase OafA/YrhL
MATKTRTKGSLGLVSGWLAWRRRSRPNKVLFLASVLLALFVTAVFAWATIDPAPGDETRYLLLYWVWGLCAIAILLGMAEYKTSPLRKNGERGQYFILLYIGSLLIITRALNLFLYHGP